MSLGGRSARHSVIHARFTMIYILTVDISKEAAQQFVKTGAGCFPSALSKF